MLTLQFTNLDINMQSNFDFLLRFSQFMPLLQSNTEKHKQCEKLTKLLQKYSQKVKSTPLGENKYKEK